MNIEDKILTEATRIQEESSRFSNSFLENNKNTEVEYQDLMNVFFFKKIAELNLKIKELQDEKGNSTV